MADQLPIRDALLSFAPQAPLRAALFLTFSFDGRWFEEAILADLCDRPIATMLVIHDRNAIANEGSSVRYHRSNANHSRVFHPKLALLIAEGQARAIISSANLTRGGFERQSELGRVFDLDVTNSAEKTLFEGLVDFLAHGVSREVQGTPADALQSTINALQELLSRCDSPSKPTSHRILHSYSDAIWTQMLRQLPHRSLRQAVIVSPFFEADDQDLEDPRSDSSDASLFNRMLSEDFELSPPKDRKPIHVYFRLRDGHTELPVNKLSSHSDKIAFFAQKEQEKRLHAKLVLLEGAKDTRNAPYLVALHGSPNFTSAALLGSPPHGNAELAVLTNLPAKPEYLDKAISLLGLDTGFYLKQDLDELTSITRDERTVSDTAWVADATYRIAAEELILCLMKSPPPGARIRVSIYRDGNWISMGEVEVGESLRMAISAPGMLQLDTATNLHELLAASVRVELLDANGEVLAFEAVPVNVDSPEDFCGLTLLGAVMLSLDERIARAGAGLPPSYREQQQWLEARRTAVTAEVGLTFQHHADLDRFYRNVHQGLSGVLQRCKATPYSEFTYRRNLDALTSWAAEASVDDSATMQQECRLFLVDRTLRTTHESIEAASSTMRAQLPSMALALNVEHRFEQIATWLDSFRDSTLTTYARETRARLLNVRNALQKGGPR